MNNSSPKNSEASEGRRTASKRRQTINGWLLLVTAVVLFILVPALYFWHYYQARRLSESFLVRAEELQGQHDPHAAAEYLQRYLQIKPENADVRMRLAEVYDSSATDFPSKRRATELYFQAIGWAEKEKIPPLRSRVGDILLETGQFIAAEKESLSLIEEVQQLKKEQHSSQELSIFHAKGLRLRALAIYGQVQQGSWKKSEDEKRSVAEIIEEALKSNPNDHELIRAIVKIYREEPQYLAEDNRSLAAEQRNARADRYLDDLVSADPNDTEALLMRYSYKRFYRLPDAAADLEHAMQIGKDNARVLLAKADADQMAAQEKYRQSGRIDESISLFDSAMKYYQQVLQISEAKLIAEDSKDKDLKAKSRLDAQSPPPSENWREIQQYAWVNLGTIQKIRGDAEAALKTWRTGLEKIPYSFALNLLVADTLLELGRTKEVARADKSNGQEGPVDVLETLVLRMSTGSGANDSGDSQELKYHAQMKALEQTVQLLRGKWHHQRDEYHLALPLLQQVAQGEKNTLQQTNEVLQAYLLTGDICLHRDQMDQAATAFEAAAALNLRTALPHLGAAKAWEALGRYDLAEKHLRQALELQDSPQKRLQLAQLFFHREMQKPNTGRQWSDFDKALSDAPIAKIESDPTLAWQLNLLAIEAAHVRNSTSQDPATARAEIISQLKQLEAKYPNITAFMETLIPIYASLNAAEDAERVADQYAKLNPREAAPYILRARVAMLGRQFDRAQSILEEGVALLPSSEKADLTREIIGLNISQNRLKEASERLKALLQKAGGDKRLAPDSDTIKLIFAMALQTLDKEQPSESKRWEDELVRIEGPQGTLWRYCRARRWVILAKGQNDPRLAEAESSLAELKKMRPSWGQVFLLEAVILQKRGKLEDAVDACRTAIQYGCRHLAVYEKLVGLLGRLGRYADIERCLADLDNQSSGSTALTAMGIALAAERGQWRQAINLARRNNEIEDPQAAITLSRLLAINNQEEKAEETLRNALRTSPENAALHYQLLAWYVRNGKQQLAREYLERLKDNLKLPEAERMRLLAQGYDLVQDASNSKAAWTTAISLTKDTPEEQTALAEQLMNRDPKAAEIALRKALKSDRGFSRAQRLLAQILVARGGEKPWNEALSLLSQKQANPHEERLCQALQAKIYASRGGLKNLAQARTIVERLVSDPNQARSEDRLLLARIYELEGKLDKAQEQLRAVVQSAYSNAPQVAAYVEFLLQSELPADEKAAKQLKEETEKWLDKLQELAPENLQTFALRARFLKKLGRQEEIEPLIEGWVKMIQPKIPDKTKDKVLVFDKVGDLYTMVQMHSAAERWYRRSMEKDSNRYRNVAQSLARQGRFEASLQLCHEAAEKDSSAQPFVTAAMVMLEGQPSTEDYDRADAFLAKEEETQRNQPEFLNVLAALRIQQSRMDEATSLLRRVVELRPQDVVAINNLATVLAEQPDKVSEGKKLLEQAMALAGPQAGLLDLKGVILIAEGNPQEAIPLFEEACAAPQADPRYCFHGAVAYKRAGKLEKAEQALQRARNLNLHQQILTPGDKKMLAELEKVFIRKNL